MELVVAHSGTWGQKALQHPHAINVMGIIIGRTIIVCCLTQV